MTDASPSGSDARTAATLLRLAAVLDCPVETFYASPGSGDPTASTQELLRSWNEITEPEARERILSFVRREAERRGGTSGPRTLASPTEVGAG